MSAHSSVAKMRAEQPLDDADITAAMRDYTKADLAYLYVRGKMLQAIGGALAGMVSGSISFTWGTRATALKPRWTMPTRFTSCFSTMKASSLTKLGWTPERRLIAILRATENGKR
jgi:hypothetical protein